MKNYYLSYIECPVKGDWAYIAGNNVLTRELQCCVLCLKYEIILHCHSRCWCCINLLLFPKDQFSMYHTTFYSPLFTPSRLFILRRNWESDKTIGMFIAVCMLSHLFKKCKQKESLLEMYNKYSLNSELHFLGW